MQYKDFFPFVMENTTTRLSEFLNYKGIKEGSLERELDIGDGTIRKAVKSQGSMGSKILERLFGKFPDLNPDWLLTGKGSMLRSEGVSVVSSSMSSEDVSWYRSQIDKRDTKIEALEEEIRKLRAELKVALEGLASAEVATVSSGATARVG